MMRIGGFFSGIGAHHSAADRLGIDYTMIFQCEFDPPTARAYDTLHGETRNLGDITQIHDIGGENQVDVLFWTPPCIRKGDKVLTKERGYIPIEEVEVGDMVMSHDGQWHPVEWAGKTGHKDILGIKASCSLEIGATPEHRFYARKKEYTHENRQRKRVFTEPNWIEAADLTTKHYLGFPVGEPQPIPQWDGVEIKHNGSPFSKNEISQYLDNESFWWSVGRYIADGWTRYDGQGIVIAVGKGKEKDLDRLFPMFLHNVSKEGSVYKFQINRQEIAAFLTQFGKGAMNKIIPEQYMYLPKNLARAMLDGYFAGDGSVGTHGIKCGTVSLNLALNLVREIGYAYERPAHISLTNVAEHGEIEGRVINQHPYYEVYFHPEVRKQDKSFYEDGWVWTQIRRIESIGTEDVYDLTVKDSHSFTVNGIIVHNCQDISNAGRLAGNAKDSGTRSSLAFEVPRILRNTGERERPKYLVMEEVPMMVSKKFKANFDELMDELSAIGYNHTWKVLNACDYGVAQNRKRLFVISKLNGKLPEMPKPIPLTKCMRDYLEPEPVDERYYLSQDRLKGLIWSSERESDRGRGFCWNPQHGERKASCINCHDGNRKTGNYVITEGNLEWHAPQQKRA